MSVRNVIMGSLIVVLFLAAIFLFLEIVGILWPDFFARAELPFWTKVTVASGATVLAVHRIVEWRDFRQEHAFPRTIAGVFERVALVDFNNADTKQNEFAKFVSQVLEAFVTVFKGKRDVRINVMLYGRGDLLRISFAAPEGVTYPDHVVFKSGEGGAGVAFEQVSPIYFPATRYGHGISFKDGSLNLLEGIYKHLEGVKCKSVICCPIRVREKTVGVLNIDSQRQSAFDIRDVEIARVAGTVIGMALDRYGQGA